MLSLLSTMFITPFFHINPYNLHPKLIEQSSLHWLVVCVKLIIDHPQTWCYMLKKKKENNDLNTSTKNYLM